MTLKDKLTLFLSTLAFLVSATTLSLNQLENVKAEEKKTKISGYSAVELGRRVGTAFWSHLLANQGPEYEVSKARKNILQFARDAQPYAISLDVRLEIDTLIARCAITDAVDCFEPPEITIRSRLIASSGKDAADAFSLAYNLSTLDFITRAGGASGDAGIAFLESDHKDRLIETNKMLEDFGYKERVPLSFESPDLVIKGSRRALEELARSFVNES